ncbi:MAG: gliding motility-associated C-terminal domain-containing protein, partial [Chitinophagaceae bacterium]
WSWRFPNGVSSERQNPPFQKYSTAGTFPIITTAVNSSGCANSDTLLLVVNPLPVITLPSPLTKVVGAPLTIPATYSNGIASYLWSPAATLNCADCPQPITTTKFNTKYTVIVSDSNSCSNTAEVEVIVICKGNRIFLPNTFSPNGDGTNDKFYARGTGLDRVKSLRIFNRWGETSPSITPHSDGMACTKGRERCQTYTCIRWKYFARTVNCCALKETFR